MGLIYQAVKNIIIFLLLVAVLGNLLGKSAYKKYVDIFVGLVLIIIVITPILKLLHSDAKVDLFYNQNLYKMSAKDMGEQLLHADKGYQDSIIKEYKKAIQDQITTTLKKEKLATKSVEINIDSNVDSAECGKIKKISIEASKEEKEVEKENSLEVDKVDRVAIDKIKINQSGQMDEKKEHGEAQHETVEELKVKEELAALYGVEQEKIEVSIT